MDKSENNKVWTLKEQSLAGEKDRSEKDAE